MKSQHNTKQLSSWPFILALCLLIVVGTLAVKLWPRTVPFDQCSDIYKRYVGVEGIDVSFIKDFKVNDSVFVDVTLLEAKDSAGWAALKHDFSVPELNAEWQQLIDNGNNLIFSRKIAKISHPLNIHVNTTNCDVLAISRFSHTLIVFHTNNNNEIHAIFHRNYQESINQ